MRHHLDVGPDRTALPARRRRLDRSLPPDSIVGPVLAETLGYSLLKKNRPALVAVSCILLLGGAAAQPPFALPETAPIPFAPPDAAGGSAAIDRINRVAAIRPAVAGAFSGTLRAGLDALSAGDAAAAAALRDSLPKKVLDRRILTWAIARYASESLTSAGIAEAVEDLAGWPDLDVLYANGERALYRERPPAQAVLDAFSARPPRTYPGKLALSRAELALGMKEKARARLSALWRVEKLESAQETAFLDEFGALLQKADHRHRMERMLYEERVRSAGRVAGPAGAQALARAWSAVIRGAPNAGDLLAAVPKEQRSAGYIFATVRHLRRSGRYSEAAKAMLTAPRDAAALIDADEWWIERRALSRELLDAGDFQGAYRIAAAHAAESPALEADAEFHAGWYALRFLDEPNKAAVHFARIADIAEGPISSARAHYWLARAAEAGGPGMASDHYARAARHGTAFYGQLAAARLGRSTIRAAYPEPDGDERRAFSARAPVRAIERLRQAGHAWRAPGLFRALAGMLTSPGELTLLAAMAEAAGDHRTALQVGKIAAARGIDTGGLAYPLGAIPAEAALPVAGKALAYAVARQETEFNGIAVSSAGARGLLQLMPATAREMARKQGLPYSRDRLTADPGYNAVLGSAYLGEQLDRFGGSYVLTLIGYNAGPRRAAEWIGRYGDPRGQPVEAVVDWIERIPYPETRNYVQRVVENLQVYKMRLAGRFDINHDLTAGC